MTKPLPKPNANTPNPGAAAEAATTTEATKATTTEATKATTTEAATKAAEAATPINAFSDMIGQRAWLVSVHGDMMNLHTNELFTKQTPKKAAIDQFIASQLEAKKMAIHVDEE